MTEQAWIVWAQDMFDRDTPRSRTAQGRGLARGLGALWQAHLDEGVLDDGRQTLTRFYIEMGGGQLQIPDHCEGARLLRAWLRSGSLTPLKLGRMSLANDDPDDGLQAILETAARVQAPEALLRALLAPTELLADARRPLVEAARRQERGQWLGVGAYAVLIAGLALAAGLIEGAPAGVITALNIGMAVFGLLLVGTIVETLLRRRRQQAVLVALERPERVTQVRSEEKQVRNYRVHRLRITIESGETAVFTLPRDEASFVLDEMRVFTHDR